MRAMNAGDPKKSLLVVIFEPPYPPIHGGRFDQWNRYLYLKSLGWDLRLVTWVRASVHTDIPGLRKALSAAFSQIYFLRNEMTPANLFFRLLCLPVYSQHISNMYVMPKDRRALFSALENWRPAAVMMDHIYSSLLAWSLAEHFAVPLFYRANNIEHVYVRQMAKAAETFRAWLKFRLAAFHMKSFEYELHGNAAWTFDCSADDMAFWRDQGFLRTSWAPPLVNPALLSRAKTISWDERPYDAVFLGSLFSVANIEAVHWFFSDVMPALVRRKPDIRVLIAGAKPVASLQVAALKWPQAELLANPPDAAAVRAQGRVLINPILSGSGINVKMIEMLFSDSPIVTTPVGLRGFDEESRRAFIVADGPERFAEKIIAALSAGPVGEAARASFRDRFSKRGAEAFSHELETVIR